MAITDYDIMRMGGRGIAPSAMTANQRKLAYQFQRNPDYTLHEAKEAAGVIKPHYTKKQLAEMAAHTPWEDLNPAQKKLMRKYPDEKVTPEMVAYYTGSPLSEIMLTINMRKYGGIDPKSLVYKASRGFFGKTRKSGVQVILYGRVETGVGEYITMDTPANIEKTIREKAPCPTPPCADDEVVTTYIPLKDGAMRTNISSGKEAAA